MRDTQLFLGLLFSSLAVIGLGAGAACSADAPTPAVVVGNDGGDSAPITATEAKQTGTIADAIDKFEVPGAVVTIAGKSVTTGADGKYEILVPRNVPYSMSVVEGSHYKLNEQEWIVKKDLIDRPGTLLLSTDIANLLASYLPMRDKAKGLLVVRIYPMAPCDSEQGSTLSIEPAGASKITYFSNGRPNQNQPSTIKDESFSGAFSDVEINVPIKVTVNSPLCEQVPFPIETDDVTYTGVQKTEPGEVLSYIRVYIGPRKTPIADAAAE
jgi:hypothetical protein